MKMLVLAIFIVQMSAFMDISDARNANVFFFFCFLSASSFTLLLLLMLVFNVLQEWLPLWILHLKQPFPLIFWNKRTE